MTLEQCKQEYKWRRSFLRAGLQGTPAQIDEAIRVALGTEDDYIANNINNEPLPQYILQPDKVVNDVAEQLEEMNKYPDGTAILENLSAKQIVDKYSKLLTATEVLNLHYPEKDLNGIIQELKAEGQDIKQISDGYHTFDELYEFRKMYNAVLFNEWGSNYGPWNRTIRNQDAAYSFKYNVHKSWKHSDGEWCFGEEKKWFIVSAKLPTGLISNHYKAEDWDLFKIPEVEQALFEYDGHTPQDVLDRLKAL